jgi:hypothetical protein
MSDNILESYLVKLGYKVDNASLLRFKASIHQATSSVESIAKVTLGATAVAGGFFTGLALGAVKLIDKVAMADQSYRLFALRMFTTQKVGRELSMTLKALGVTLEDITWDKELHGRAMQMFKDQETILAEMGPGFEKNMVLVRDMKFEFQRLGVVAQYSLQDIIGKLIQGLAPEWFKMQGGLKGAVDYLIQNLPAIDTMITGKIVWGLKEVKKVSLEIWEVFKQMDTAIVGIIGALTGHPELVGKPFSAVNNIAAAKAAATGITNEMGRLTGDISGFMAPPKATGSQFQRGRQQANEGSRDLTLALGAWAWGNHHAGDEYFKKSMVLTGKAIGNQTEGWLLQPEARNILHRMEMMESGGHQFGPGGQVLTSSAGAMGLMQLMPKTAASLGVDPRDPAQNLWGGQEYMSQLVARYHGNVREAAMAYNWGPSHLDAALRNHTAIPQSVQDYGNRAAGVSSVHIGSVHIHVPAGTSTFELPASVSKGMQDALDKHTKRNRLQSVTGPYAHGTGN